MADIQVYGFIEGIRYHETSVIVTISERRLGYKKKDGTIIDDDIMTWHIAFKPYFKKYISSHFSSGMLVKVKGIALPYAKEKDNVIKEGYSFIGQTIDMAAYPKNSTRRDARMIKESVIHAEETPDVDAYMQEDF